jgi:L-2,4-diaminobutyrate decarboxylase
MTTFSPAAIPVAGPLAPMATQRSVGATESSVSPTRPHPDPDLLASDPAGLASLGRLAAELTRAARAGVRRRTGPLPAGTPADSAARVAADLADLSDTPTATDGAGPAVLPRRGLGLNALHELVRRYAEGTVDLSDPAAAAHLQPPALTVAVAADLIANAFNASVDTWDSGPYALELERHVIAALTHQAGFGPAAGGVLTSGGSASNLQALMIARDAALAARLRRDAGPSVAAGDPAATGGAGPAPVPAAGAAGGGAPGAEAWPAGLRPVVFCSEVAHFSVAKSCAVLGLGASAVRTVPVDGRWRMRADALADALAALPPDAVPVAVVATAGTTDFGSVDPLRDCAAIAARHGVRLHVDAAYGGGALFSDRLRHLLAGLSGADSVTIDLHKTAWQPAAASALLLRDAADFAPYSSRVAYLNPDDDGARGYDGLLDHSLATTRRADALKVAATFLTLGRDGLGDLLDGCHELARHAERRVAAEPRLELLSGAQLTTVVFRYRAGDRASTVSDTVNGALRRRLLRGGTALIGRTTVPGRGVHLKLTLLNPTATPVDIDALVDAVLAAGAQESQQSQASQEGNLQA